MLSLYWLCCLVVNVLVIAMAPITFSCCESLSSPKCILSSIQLLTGPLSPASNIGNPKSRLHLHSTVLRSSPVCSLITLYQTCWTALADNFLLLYSLTVTVNSLPAKTRSVSCFPRLSKEPWLSLKFLIIC